MMKLDLDKLDVHVSFMAWDGEIVCDEYHNLDQNDIDFMDTYKSHKGLYKSI